jgi:small subunit ribosomal protein S1
VTDQPEPKAPPGAETPEAETPSHDDFAKLLASTSDAKRYAKGALIRGTVAQIGDTDVLVDVGGKSEAMIARSELLGEDGELTVKIGDAIEATVLSVDGSIRLSKKLVTGAKNKELLMEAF